MNSHFSVCDQTSRKSRVGFTLAEMVLVIAVLITIGAVTLPPVMRLMAEYPLKEAAEKARSQIANSRIKALDSGVAWQFRFEPGGRRMLWLPAEPASTATAANSGTAMSGSTSSGNSAPQVVELSKDISFCSEWNGMTIPAAQLPPELTAGMSNAYEIGQVAWSSPIAFQPDGTTSDLELAVWDKRGQQIVLSLRGLTGGVTVSNIQPRSRR